MIDLPIVMDDVFDQSLIKFVKDRHATYLKYGWKSSGYAEHDAGHWNNQVIAKPKFVKVCLSETPEYETLPEIQRMWNTLIGVIGEKRTLLRCYCNGYTYGTDGYTHVDDRQTGTNTTASETVIVYLNDGKWEMDWGGETIVYNNDEEPEIAVKPKTGRIFIFDSQKWHRALPLSRAYGGLRTIITFKTFEQDYTSDVFKRNKEWSINIPHRTNSHGNSLWHHQWYTARILEKDLNAHKDTCLAGLFHACCYGTEFFPLQYTHTRDEVKSLVGETVENLIWEFSQLGKNRNWDLLNRNGNWSDRTWGRLIQIEIANGMEQGTLQNGPELYDVLDELKKKDEL
jgi:SM-20-related protein